jgi:replicative DNA helicase
VVEGDRDGKPVSPHDAFVEQCVLGGMLLFRQAADEVIHDQAVTVNDFFIPAHRLLFEVIRDMYVRENSGGVGPVGIALAHAGRLDEVGGVGYLQELAGVVDEHVPTFAYADILKTVTENRVRAEAMGLLDEDRPLPEPPSDFE